MTEKQLDVFSCNNATSALTIEIQVLKLQHAQDIDPKSHTISLRALFKCLLNPAKLGVVMLLPVPKHTPSE